MKIGRLLMPVFAVTVGVSFVAAEVYAAKESVDLTGRARGWYQNVSSKADDDADSVSNSEFRADARMGITIKTTQGGWTGSAKAELETHNDGDGGAYSTGYRDTWAQIENNTFALRVGRQWHGDYCVSAYAPIKFAGDDCVGGLIGRTQGASVSIKGLPVSLDASFIDVDVDKDDKIGFNGRVGFKVMNASVNALYEGTNQEGNKDRGGIKKKTQDVGLFGILGKMPVGKMTLSGGYEYRTTSTNSGEAKAKDKDDTRTEIKAAAAFDLGDGMGVGGFYNMTTTDHDEKGRDNTVVSEFTVGFAKKFASTTMNAGYFNSRTEADSTLAKNDGAYETGFAAGFQSNF